MRPGRRYVTTDLAFAFALGLLAGTVLTFAANYAAIFYMG
jgi:hypothetical protein